MVGSQTHGKHRKMTHAEPKVCTCCLFFRSRVPLAVFAQRVSHPHSFNAHYHHHPPVPHITLHPHPAPAYTYYLPVMRLDHLYHSVGLSLLLLCHHLFRIIYSASTMIAGGRAFHPM
jgi:hypothetical protein